MISDARWVNLFIQTEERRKKHGATNALGTPTEPVRLIDPNGAFYVRFYTVLVLYTSWSTVDRSRTQNHSSIQHKRR